MKRYLRVLLLVLALPIVAAIGIGCLYLTETGRQVDAIQKRGGIASVQYTGPNWRWLERMYYLGRTHALDEVFQVWLGSTPSGPAEKYRRYGGTIRSIHYPKFRDEDLADLTSTFASLGELEELGISNCQVTDAGLKHLAALQGVDSLYLLELSITDQGLQHIKDVKGLKTLSIVGCDVSDGALDRFEKETDIKVIRE